MAKRFQFEDEEDNLNIQEETSRIDELEQMKEASSDPVIDTLSYEDTDVIEDETMPKKKKKFDLKNFEWKWWHYCIIGIVVLFIAFMVYIFALSNSDGPVYGNRCEGVIAIPNDNIDAALTEAKSKHSEIETISMDVECKILHVDITFKDGVKTKTAQSIAEDSVKILDGLVGRSKDDGKTYSQLFGHINNVAQYEVNFFLVANNNEDFPIYGTKHVQNDSFSYTLASVKDKESKEKAESTLSE